MASSKPITVYVRFVLPGDMFPPTCPSFNDSVVSYIHKHLEKASPYHTPLVMAVNGESCCEVFSTDSLRRMGSLIAGAHRVVHTKPDVSALMAENDQLRRELEALKRSV